MAARIVTVGSTKDGITSTIYCLLPQKPITDSFCINEYQIAVTAQGSQGGNFSTVTIIDTPGFNNDRNDSTDQTIATTLMKHLERNKNAYASDVLLIVTRFDNNRFKGEESDFEKMLKTIYPIFTRSPSTNSDWNCVLVLTHCYSIWPELTKNDGVRSRVNEFCSILAAKFPLFKSGRVALAENEGLAYNLETGPDGFILPNGGPTYPGNLVEILSEITNHPKFMFDPTQNSSLCQVERTAKIQLEEIPMQSKYISGNPLFQKLQEISVANPQWRQSTLFTIGKAFESSNINSRLDLPKTDFDIIQFLQKVPKDETALQILTGPLFKIPIPVLTDSKPMIGQGFNIQKDFMVQNSIFNYSGRNTFSELGFLIPVEVEMTMGSSIVDVCTFYKSDSEYFLGRLEDLSVGGYFDAYAGELRPSIGYNILKMGEILPNVVTGVKEHRKFKLILKPEFIHGGYSNIFTQDFKEDVRNLKIYSGNEGLEQRNRIRQSYEAFISRYGTHVVVSCYGGGAIQVSFPGNDSYQSTAPKCIDTSIFHTFVNAFSKMDVKENLENPGKVYESIRIENHGVVTSIWGGNKLQGDSTLLYGPTKEVRQAVKEWDNSIALNPEMLTTKLELIPISSFAGKIWPEIAGSLDRAIRDITCLTKGSYLHPTSWPILRTRPFIYIHGNKYSRSVPFAIYQSFLDRYCNIL